MNEDPILCAARTMRELGLTGTQAIAARIVTDGEPTLAALLASVPPEELEGIRARYPQGLTALLDGVPAEHGLAAVVGFADRRYSQLTSARVAPGLRLYQEQVAARLATRGNPDGRAGNGPRDGYAARQYKYAARAVVELLLRHRLVPMTR